MKKYGYFGSGLDGYIHYKLAFDRNFESEKSDDYSESFPYSEPDDFDKDELDFDDDYDDL